MERKANQTLQIKETKLMQVANLFSIVIQALVENQTILNLRRKTAKMHLSRRTQQHMRCRKTLP